MPFPFYFKCNGQIFPGITAGTLNSVELPEFLLELFKVPNKPLLSGVISMLHTLPPTFHILWHN